MSNEELNMVIEEAIDPLVFVTEKGCCFRYTDKDKNLCEWHRPLDYCGDLNAVHVARRQLTKDQRCMYVFHLASITNSGLMSEYGEAFKSVDATARQHAEALAKTLGVWKGGQP